MVFTRQLPKRLQFAFESHDELLFGITQSSAWLTELKGRYVDAHLALEPDGRQCIAWHTCYRRQQPVDLNL